MYVNNKKSAVGSLLKNISKSFYEKHHKEKNYQIINVKSLPFKEIINKKNCPKIDLFSIDVEGSELELLITFDWNIKVKVFLIEFNELFKESHSAIRNLLIEIHIILIKE